MNSKITEVFLECWTCSIPGIIIFKSNVYVIFPKQWRAFDINAIFTFLLEPSSPLPKHDMTFLNTVHFYKCIRNFLNTTWQVWLLFGTFWTIAWFTICFYLGFVVCVNFFLFMFFRSRALFDAFFKARPLVLQRTELFGVRYFQSLYVETIVTYSNLSSSFLRFLILYTY